MVIIKESPVHGKGVFSTCFLKTGTILPCDVLEVSKDLKIMKYVLCNVDIKYYIHIGFASFFNSSEQPNVKHLSVDFDKGISYFEIITDVQEGEEIFLKYIIT
jgi:hypothetical protein